MCVTLTEGRNKKTEFGLLGRGPLEEGLYLGLLGLVSRLPLCSLGDIVKGLQGPRIRLQNDIAPHSLFVEAFLFSKQFNFLSHVANLFAKVGKKNWLLSAFCPLCS